MVIVLKVIPALPPPFKSILLILVNHLRQPAECGGSRARVPRPAPCAGPGWHWPSRRPVSLPACSDCCPGHQAGPDKVPYKETPAPP